jgi:hypothetical protein
LLDLLSLLPLRATARDLCSGSGLTANRTNLPNASELCLAFDWASRSSRPALCYRPLLAFPPHFAMLRVTQLEPRTPDQARKREGTTRQRKKQKKAERKKEHQLKKKKKKKKVFKFLKI